MYRKKKLLCIQRDCQTVHIQITDRVRGNPLHGAANDICLVAGQPVQAMLWEKKHPGIEHKKRAAQNAEIIVPARYGPQVVSLKVNREYTFSPRVRAESNAHSAIRSVNVVRTERTERPDRMVCFTSDILSTARNGVPARVRPVCRYPRHGRPPESTVDPPMKRLLPNHASQRESSLAAVGTAPAAGSAGSILENGSSSRSSGGCLMRARAMATRCC